MSRIDEIPWVIEEPTKIKHQLLNDYLGAWMSILYSNQSLIGREKKLIYVDGFSGPGEYWADETKSAKVNGSPVLVAEKANKYIDEDKNRKFLIIAIDSEKRCIDSLKPILEGKNKHKQEWQVLHTTFEQGMDELFGYLETNNARIAPAFFFVDPFGYSGFTMETMLRILKHPRTELFINFMHYDINRFLQTDHSQGHLQALFGSDDYKNAADLSSDEKISYLMDLYCKNLKKGADGIYTLPFRMNTPGQGRRPRYFLIHVSQHIKALKEMKNCMARASSQAFSFEAIGLGAERQLNLFDLNDEEKLKKQISVFLNRYCGKDVLYQNIENWAYEHTAGVRKDIQTALIELEQAGNLTIERKLRQRQSTVTEGALIGLDQTKEEIKE
jgi:three-Cys-motif partner protein